MDNAQPLNNPLKPGQDSTQYERGEEDKYKKILYQEAIAHLLQ